ncbi:MAG: biotin--[acetyl-CoA-carboxylase] ligase, partial [Brevibacterium sp.]|nr:biotin--[acetyl-CoA-carboxylase] ligase [Brevibacterium sp.]
MNSQHSPFLVDVESLRRKAAARDLDLPVIIWDDVCTSTNDELAALVRGQTTLTDAPTDRTRRIATSEGIDLAEV